MNILQFPKATLQHDENTFDIMNLNPGGSKGISASTQGSCSHCGFRGEGALHDPHVLRVACLPSSPQISYLRTITTIHSQTKTQGKSLVGPSDLLSGGLWVVRCCQGGLDLIESGPLTSVLSYSGHFTPSESSCFGIFFVGVEMV